MVRYHVPGGRTLGNRHADHFPKEQVSVMQVHGFPSQLCRRGPALCMAFSPCHGRAVCAAFRGRSQRHGASGTSHLNGAIGGFHTNGEVHGAQKFTPGLFEGINRFSGKALFRVVEHHDRTDTQSASGARRAVPSSRKGAFHIRRTGPIDPLSVRQGG